MITVVLADGKNIVRQSIKTLLDERYPEIEVVGEADTGIGAYNLCLNLNPDVLIIEATMPKMGGIDAVRLLKKRRPACKCIILAEDIDDVMIMFAKKFGASAYLSKWANIETLVKTIRLVSRGGTYFGKRDPEPIIGSLKYPSLDPWRVDLSRRETEILALIAEGYSNSEMASYLGLADCTVRNIRYSLIKKTACHGIACLTRYAMNRFFMRA